MYPLVLLGLVSGGAFLEDMKRAYRKWFLTPVGRAIKNYAMIIPGDHVTVAASGGQDSSALLYILWLIRENSALDFSLSAVFVDLGWQIDTAPLEDFCRARKIPFYVENTIIKDIVFTYRKEPHPCALCSHLRRGALNDVALRIGSKKVALGHHLDDALETFLLNWLYNGRLGSFLPITYLSRSDITVIRPLVYVPKKTLAALASLEKLPQLPNPCPAQGQSKRHQVRELVAGLEKIIPDIRQKFLSLLESPSPNLWYPHLKRHS